MHSIKKQSFSYDERFHFLSLLPLFLYTARRKYIYKWEIIKYFSYSKFTLQMFHRCRPSVKLYKYLRLCTPFIYWIIFHSLPSHVNDFQTTFEDTKEHQSRPKSQPRIKDNFFFHFTRICQTFHAQTSIFKMKILLLIS